MSKTGGAWLASNCVAVNQGDYRVHFDMRYVYSDKTNSGTIFYSNKDVGFSCGLRPVVSFNINRLDISDITKTGTESAPWEIK